LIRPFSLFQLKRKLVASPEYVARRTPPTEPRDLAGWDWIRLASRPPRATFTGAGGRAVDVQLRSRVTVDGGHALLKLAELGLGLAMVPAALAEREIVAGRVVEVLPSWRLEAHGVYAVWPANAPRAGLAHRLIDFLAKRRDAPAMIR